MTHFPYSIVGFDLDGTLVDTSGDLAAAVNHALGLANRPPLETAQVVAMIGGGTRNMLGQAMAATGGGDAETLDRMLAAMLEYYAAHIAVESRPYPGAVAALDALQALGVKTAIVTNKMEGLARKLLDALGILDRFATVIGGDTLGAGLAKPNRAPIDAMMHRVGERRAAFVGDSIYDVTAARSAGIPVVAVSFGFAHGQADALGADAVIARYADLIPTLEMIGARPV